MVSPVPKCEDLHPSDEDLSVGTPGPGALASGQRTENRGQRTENREQWVTPFSLTQMPFGGIESGLSNDGAAVVSSDASGLE